MPIGAEFPPAAIIVHVLHMNNTRSGRLLLQSSSPPLLLVSLLVVLVDSQCAVGLVLVLLPSLALLFLVLSSEQGWAIASIKTGGRDRRGKPK